MEDTIVIPAETTTIVANGDGIDGGNSAGRQDIQPPPPPPEISDDETPEPGQHQQASIERHLQSSETLLISRSCRSSRGSKSSSAKKGGRSSSKDRKSKSMSPGLKRRKKAALSDKIADERSGGRSRSSSLSILSAEPKRQRSHREKHKSTLVTTKDDEKSPDVKQQATCDVSDVDIDRKDKDNAISKHSKSSRANRKPRSSTLKSKSLSPTKKMGSRRKLTSEGVASVPTSPNLTASSSHSKKKKKKFGHEPVSPRKGDKGSSPSGQVNRRNLFNRSPSWTGTVDEVDIAEAIEYLRGRNEENSGRPQMQNQETSKEMDIFEFLAEGRNNDNERNDIRKMGFMSDSRLMFHPSSPTDAVPDDSEIDSGSGHLYPSSYLRRPSLVSLSFSNHDKKSLQQQNQEPLSPTTAASGSPSTSLTQKFDLVKRKMPSNAADASSPGVVSPGKMKKKLGLFSTALALNSFEQVDSDDDLNAGVTEKDGSQIEKMSTRTISTASATTDQELELQTRRGSEVLYTEESLEFGCDANNDAAFDILFDHVIKKKDNEDPNTRAHLEWTPVADNPHTPLSSSEPCLPLVSRDEDNCLSGSGGNNGTEHCKGDEGENGAKNESHIDMDGGEVDEQGRADCEAESKRNGWKSKPMKRFRRSFRSLSLRQLQRHESLKDVTVDEDEKKRRPRSSRFSRSVSLRQLHPHESPKDAKVDGDGEERKQRRSNSLFGRMAVRRSSKKDLHVNDKDSKDKAGDVGHVGRDRERNATDKSAEFHKSAPQLTCPPDIDNFDKLEDSARQSRRVKKVEAKGKRRDKEQRRKEKELKALKDSLIADGLLDPEDVGLLKDVEYVNVYKSNLGQSSQDRSFSPSRRNRPSAHQGDAHNHKTGRRRSKSKMGKAKSPRKSHIAINREQVLEDLERSFQLRMSQTSGLYSTDDDSDHDDSHALQQSDPSVLRQVTTHRKSGTNKDEKSSKKPRKKEVKKKSKKPNKGNLDSDMAKAAAQEESNLMLHEDEVTETTYDESEAMSEDWATASSDRINPCLLHKDAAKLHSPNGASRTSFSSSKHKTKNKGSRKKKKESASAPSVLVTKDGLKQATNKDDANETEELHGIMSDVMGLIVARRQAT